MVFIKNLHFRFQAPVTMMIQSPLGMDFDGRIFKTLLPIWLELQLHDLYSLVFIITFQMYDTAEGVLKTMGTFAELGAELLNW
jgi:hypothetical protein